MPSLGNNDYDLQVALDQWVKDSDDAIKNLVALTNIISPPVLS